ncbi:MAG: TonB-dependent receptor, partial [Candidatus Solibacter sp.]|nr:TonB-dependent receptor [Candidatus Solibacter sp.]
MSKVQRRIRFLLLFVCSAACLLAQSDRGVISGSVKDSSGASVPEARVTVTHVQTNVASNTVTTSTGVFAVPALPVGSYRLVVEKAGFKLSIHGPMELNGGSGIQVDAVLEIGTAQQSVVVTSDTQMLQTESARVQSAITRKMVDELPLVVSGNMRSPLTLANITPQYSDGRLGGGQGGGLGITLDGVSSQVNGSANLDWIVLNTPSVDAITEFEVVTNGFKAEFGHGAGGLVSFVSKSGTNQFHGSAYDFARNNALDARGFFAASTAIYKQHDLGATFGGPVRIPKLYNGKDRTFFFFTYEGFRNRVGGSTTPTSIAPPEFYQGDMRNFVDQAGKQIVIYDPDTTQQVGSKYVRAPFPNNMIPQARFDPLSQKILAYGASLKPNVAGLVPGTADYIYRNYITPGVQLNPVDKLSVRLDHVLNPKNRLGFTYSYSQQRQVPGADGPPGFPGVISSFQNLWRGSNVYRGNWDSTISPRLVNHFYMGANRFYERWRALSIDGTDWASKTCIPNVFDCGLNFPTVNTGQFGTWGAPAPSGSASPIYSFNDDLTFVTGKHTLKAGYNWELQPYQGWGMNNAMGNVSFSRLNTSVPQDSNANTGGGSGWASFLLGYASAGVVETPRDVYTKFRYQSGFFQDDWRVSSRLTLNLGIRYEFELPPLNPDDTFSDFSPTTPNPAADGRPGALIFAGFGTGRTNTRTLVPGWYKGIGPRLGLSYRLGDKTVIRASGSRSFGRVQNTGGSAHNQGFSQSVTFSDTAQGVTPLYKLKEGMPAWAKPPFITPSFANDASPYYWQGVEASRLPENLAWSFTLQRQVKPNLLVEAGYSAMMGTHLVAGLLKLNQANPDTLPAALSIYTQSGRTNLVKNITDPSITALGIQKPYASYNSTVARAFQPYPQFLSIDTSRGNGDHSGHSTYHSLVTKVTKSYSHGLVVNASYVLSKAFSDA